MTSSFAAVARSLNDGLHQHLRRPPQDGQQRYGYRPDAEADFDRPGSQAAGADAQQRYEQVLLGDEAAPLGAAQLR
jgi:hypothetical protein